MEFESSAFRRAEKNEAAFAASFSMCSGLLFDAQVIAGRGWMTTLRRENDGRPERSPSLAAPR